MLLESIIFWNALCENYDDLTNVYQIYSVLFFLYSFDRDWRKIETYVGSKTAIQVLSIFTLNMSFTIIEF